MTENLSKKPPKGILKSGSSQELQDTEKSTTDLKWDETNILETFHPANKDYGHMKIDEPNTPYSYYEDEDEISPQGNDVLDAGALTEKMKEQNLAYSVNILSEEEEESEEETEDEKVKRKAFESKRKMHYNEFKAVKLARKLMSDEGEEDDDEEVEAMEEKKESDQSLEEQTTNNGGNFELDL